MLIKNGRIHVGNGEVLENCDILIEDGIIRRVGQNLSEENVELINANGMEIFPGFIDPVSSFGCIDIASSIKDNDEISNPITPEAKIKYAFNSDEIMLEELYKIGITTIGAAPGNKNIIGGQMAVYNTWGSNSNKMLLKDVVGLKGSVINSVKETYGKRDLCPMTRMGIFNELEKFIAEIKRKQVCKENSEYYYKGDNIAKKIINREISLFITANEATEINSLIHITHKYNLDLIICGGYQVHRCLENIREVNASVIIGEQTAYNAKNYNNTDLYKIGQLQRSGNLVSFSLTGDDGPEGKMKYLWNAIEFYKAGIDKEEVLKMMTINPANMLSIDDILGTIEEGKQADIVIYSNNPIEYYDSKLIYTIIDGNIVYYGRGKELCY